MADLELLTSSCRTCTSLRSNHQCRWLPLWTRQSVQSRYLIVRRQERSKLANTLDANWSGEVVARLAADTPISKVSAKLAVGLVGGAKAEAARSHPLVQEGEVGVGQEGTAAEVVRGAGSREVAAAVRKVEVATVAEMVVAVAGSDGGGADGGGESGGKDGGGGSGSVAMTEEPMVAIEAVGGGAAAMEAVMGAAGRRRGR